MALAANLERRIAVYYWRRRLPRAWDLKLGRRCIRVSLQTREPIRARFLAAQMNATAAELFMTLPARAITTVQLSDRFSDALGIIWHAAVGLILAGLNSPSLSSGLVTVRTVRVATLA